MKFLIILIIFCKLINCSTNILLEEMQNVVSDVKETCFRNMNFNEIFNLLSEKVSNTVIRSDVSLRKDKQINFSSKLTHQKNDLSLNVGDALHCEVIKSDHKMIKQRDSIKVYTHQVSGPVVYYTYFPTNLNTKCFSFKVRANKNVYISLSSNPDKSGPVLEAIIGALSPTKSMIRKNLIDFVAQVLSPGILDGKEFRGFWITWNNGEVNVGRENDEKPFLYYKESEMFPVNFVGISTYDASGTWLIEDPKCPDLSVRAGIQNVETNCWVLTEAVHQKTPKIRKIIEIQKYYLKLISQDFMNFKNLQTNSKELVKLCQSESQDILHRAKIIQNKLLTEQINENLSSTERSEIEHYFNDEIFEQIRSTYFEYFIYAENSLTASSAKHEPKNNEKENEIKMFEKLQEKELLQYEYESIANANECFTFKIKTGSNNNFHISLSEKDNNVLPVLDLVFMKTDESSTKCIIRKDNHDEVFQIQIPTLLLNANEYKTFWITWTNGNIRVGSLEDSREPFLYWTHEKKTWFNPKFIGIGRMLRGHNGGDWAVLHEECPQDLDIRLDD